MEIAKQFGIEPILLLAQIVNFLIILVVLKKFFYKPLVKMLESRKATIAESLKNAEQIEQKLAETEERSAQVLKNAEESATSLLENAKVQAAEIQTKAAEEARIQTEESLQKALSQMELEKEQMRKQLQAETMSLVMMVTQKILGKHLKAKEKEELTKEAIHEMSGQVH